MSPRLVIGSALVATVLAVVLFSGEANADPGDDAKDDDKLDLPPPPAVFEPNPAAEADACAWAVTHKPVEFQGEKPDPAFTLEQWLTLVSYRRAYPGASPLPTSLEELAALARLAQCVTAKLKAEPKPEPKPEPPPPVIKPVPKAPDPPAPDPPAIPVPTKVPTPGSYYQIVGGDNLLTVAGKAYNIPNPGPARLAAAQHINDAPYNKRFHDFADNLFPPKNVRISFNPRYGTPAEQWADAAEGADGGKQFAVIFIPK